MKKTLITLMALAGMAAADTVTPITDTTTGTWSTHGTISVADGVISTGFTNWQVDAATYTLNKALTYKETDVLHFSFDATNNGTGNGMLTLALVGTSNAIVIGHGNYDKLNEVAGHGDDVQVGVTDNVTATGGYGFAFTNPGDDVTLNIVNNWEDAMPNNGVTTTISGQIAWDGDSYSLTLNSSAMSGSYSCDLNLTTLDITKMVVTIEGGGTAQEGWETGTMSNLSISTPAIPEPTTATLSLLALAGLAARRRRK